MRRAICLLALFALAACDRVASEAPHRPQGGRYIGVGTYAAGELWKHVKLAAPEDKDAATTADDEHVIVVVDSTTGELRQCGDMSGACVAMNPWHRAAPGAAQPVRLDVHGAELAAQQQDDVVEVQPAWRRAK